VHRPVRGVIDLVLEDRDGPDTVAPELQSELRRVEQQVRWANQKADALAGLLGQQSRRVTRLLVLRNSVGLGRRIQNGEPGGPPFRVPGRSPGEGEEKLRATDLFCSLHRSEGAGPVSLLMGTSSPLRRRGACAGPPLDP
jgi:hypothetical protein